MKSLKVLVIVLVAMFSFSVVNAQTVHHRTTHHKHHKHVHAKKHHRPAVR
jgi:hypothetical protein